MNEQPSEVTDTSEHKRTFGHKSGGLGQFASTAICGHDITSSCLYVSALAIIYAGPWAPLCASSSETQTLKFQQTTTKPATISPDDLKMI
ncbi:hypothetical protein [Stieleria varia]|nr:hypothetical protein [Stieleria varia]